MNTPQTLQHFTLEPFDADRFANLCGQLDENLRQIEGRLGIAIRILDGSFRAHAAVVAAVLEQLELPAPATIAALRGRHYPIVRNHKGWQVVAIQAPIRC